MNKSVSSWISALCGAILIVLSTGAAWAERRVALVVGNSQYKIPTSFSSIQRTTQKTWPRFSAPWDLR